MKAIEQQISHYQKEVAPAKLLAVTKYSTIEDVLHAYQAGQRHFGESRLQELLNKAEHPQLQLPDIHWHFIGPLQSNKVKKILSVPGLTHIHSLHNIKTLEIFCQQMQAHPRDIKIFLQMNTSHEKEKQGFDHEGDFDGAIQLLQQYQMLDHLLGLMTMATLRTEDWQESARQCFADCQQMGQRLTSKYQLNPLELSMGMSRDYQLALPFGASWVRIGSAIFKEKEQ